MIYNAFGNGEDSLVFKINPSIVQEIIGDMFFHPDDHGSISWERACPCCSRVKQPRMNSQLRLKSLRSFI